MSNLGYGMSMGDIEQAMGVEPIIDDITDCLVDYWCEADKCEAKAIAELSWPMEDHDLESGYFCKGCLDELERNDWQFKAGKC